MDAGNEGADGLLAFVALREEVPEAEGFVAGAGDDGFAVRAH